MISPIKTILKNLSNTAVRFRISSRLAVAMTPAGTNGDIVKLTGDLFTLLDSDRSATYVLSMIKSRSIEVSYEVDSLFTCKVASEINMCVPCGDIGDWYTAKCTVATPAVSKAEEPKKEAEAAAPKQEEPKQEEPKQELPKQEEKPVEEVKKAESPKQEEAKADEPKAEETKTEEPKVEESKAAEPKKEAPKAGRKIKVQ